MRVPLIIALMFGMLLSPVIVIGLPEIIHKDGFEDIIGYLSGAKWDDLDGDGVWDVGEAGLAGVTI